MSTSTVVTLLAAVWVVCALGGGAILALLAKRIHPALSFRRLWIFYSGLLGFAVAAILAIGWW